MRKINEVILTLGLVALMIVGFAIIWDFFYGVKPTVKIVETVTIVEPKKPSYDYLKSITVYIVGESVTTDEDGEVEQTFWGGTGTVVKVENSLVTYILTNAHVAGKNMENVTLFVEDGLKKIEAEIVAYHVSEEIDLAVIKINSTLKGKRPVKGISLAQPQDKVYLVGHHLGRKYVYGEGVFAGYEGVHDIIQVPVLYGNSGSAVCNKDGELIAVIFAINGIGFFDVDCAHGLAVDGISVRLFLQKLKLL